MVDKGQKVVKPVYSPSSHDLEAHLCAYKKLDIYIIAQFLTIWWLKVDEYILLSNLSQNRGNCPTNSLPLVNRKTSRACASERARVQNSFLTRTRSRPCRAHARHKHAHKIHVVTRHRHASTTPSRPCETPLSSRASSFAISIRARALGQALSFDKTILARAYVAQNARTYSFDLSIYACTHSRIIVRLSIMCAHERAFRSIILYAHARIAQIVCRIYYARVHSPRPNRSI